MKTNSTSGKIFMCEGCSKLVSYPPNFRLINHRNSNITMGSFQEIGLVFRRDHFRFVSCHKKSSHWKVRLNELVFAFDTPTWLLIILALAVVAKLFTLASKTYQICNTLEFWNLYFSLFTSIIEQSSSIYKHNTLSQKIQLFALPQLFLVLSNEYKG